MDKGQETVYQFAGMRFEPAAFCLYRNDQPVVLPRKAVELLTLLLENAGRYVTKEEIFNSVWEGAFVEDGVLTQNVYLLRKAIGKTDDGSQIIENRSRLGYRISIPVERTGRAPSAEPVPDPEPVAVPEPVAAPASRRPRFYLWAAAALVFAVAFFGGYRLLRHKVSAFFRAPIEKVKFTQLTNSGNIVDAALAPAGDVVAIVRGDGLYLRDTAKPGETKLEVPNVPAFGAVQFSADGSQIYFRAARQPHAIAPIMRCPRFGGPSEVIADKSYVSFAVSRDDAFVAYYSVATSMSLKLIVRSLKTGEEREIFDSGGSASLAQPIAPAWSPDGTKIIHVAQASGTQPSRLLVIDVATARQEEIKLDGAFRYEQPEWNPDGESFMVSASENGRFYHIWRVSYPEGTGERLTNGLDSYRGTSIAADGRKVLAIQSTEDANLFVAEASALDQPKAVTSGNSNDFGRNSLVWAGDRLVYSTQSDEDKVENLWTTTIDGATRRQLTHEKEISPFGAVATESRVFYHLSRGEVSNIFAIGTDASGQAPVTEAAEGSRRLPQVSPDGTTLYYLLRSKAEVGIVRRSLVDGSEATYFKSDSVRCGFFLTLSPDGKYIACPNWKNGDGSERSSTEVAVISTTDPNDVTFVTIGGSTPFRFAPDSKSIDFVSRAGGVWQLLRQTPGAPQPVQLTTASREPIYNFAWNRDGRRLALSRGNQMRDVVILSDF